MFVYTETPYVWSRTYSFKISDLVKPTAISAKTEIGNTTRFEFPFNNLKKPAPAAYEEIEAKLEGLAETTLLFVYFGVHYVAHWLGVIPRNPASGSIRSTTLKY